MNPQDIRLSHGTVRLVDAGEGPALVLLHGLGGTWRNWIANIPGLAHGHRVIAPDLPGFGASEPYRGPVTMERYTDTIIELLDELGVDAATFVGNSMGGLLTIEAAVRHPARVRAAVLVCSGGLPLTSRRHRLVAIPQARLFNLLMRTSLARRALRSNAWARRIVAGQIVHDPGAIPADLLDSALGALGAPGFGAAFDAGLGYDARARAPHIACPTLVLWGRDDRLLPVSMGEELARLIAGAELEVWPATGHCPMIEHPARFDALVSDFVARLQRARLHVVPATRRSA